eukprot:1808965-Pyramimonas_sp.AAC.2
MFTTRWAGPRGVRLATVRWLRRPWRGYFHQVTAAIFSIVPCDWFQPLEYALLSPAIGPLDVGDDGLELLHADHGACLTGVRPLVTLPPENHFDSPPDCLRTPKKLRRRKRQRQELDAGQREM